MPDAKDDNLHKELDLIQAVMARLSQNSFYVKGWGITLSSLMLTLGKDHLLTTAQRPWLLTLVLVVWLAFWYLDAYYLRQERLFRKLYDYTITNSGDPGRLRYSLNTEPFQSDVASDWQTMQSVTLLVFYGLPALLLLGTWVYFMLR